MALGVLARTVLVLLISCSATAYAQTTLSIDFERFPGPDGQLGTPDDIVPPDFAGLSNQFSGLGITFLSGTLLQGSLFPGSSASNHFISSTPPEVVLSVPVYEVSIESYSAWTVDLVAYDADDNIIARDALINPNEGSVPPSFVLGTLRVAAFRPIARFTVTARGGAGNIPNLDNLRLVLSNSTSCSTLTLSDDNSNSNDVVELTSDGSACDTIVEITHLKNYWSNLRVDKVGAISVEPLGGGAGLYARFGVLPPSGFITLAPQDAHAKFRVRATGPGRIQFFVDPTIETGLAALHMNVAQALLNVIKGGGAPTLFIDTYERTVQAFALMPHLQNGGLALFSSSPDFKRAGKEFLAFATSLDETRELLAWLADINVTVSLASLKALAATPWRIVNSIAAIVGNFHTAFFTYPAGSAALDVSQ